MKESPREKRPNPKLLYRYVQSQRTHKKTSKGYYSGRQSLMRFKQVMTASSSRTYDRNAGNALPTISCKFCSKTHIRKEEECPAWGKQCTKCGPQNHFTIKCPQTTQPGTVNMLALAQAKYLEDPHEIP